MRNQQKAESLNKSKLNQDMDIKTISALLFHEVGPISNTAQGKEKQKSLTLPRFARESP